MQTTKIHFYEKPCTADCPGSKQDTRPLGELLSTPRCQLGRGKPAAEIRPHPESNAHMRNLLDVRIVGWRRKILYFIVAAIVVSGSTKLGSALIGHHKLFFYLYLALALAALLYGARVFRTPTEPRTPARPLWQMTATAYPSRNLGWFLLFNIVIQLINLVFGTHLGDGGQPPGPEDENISLLVLLTIVTALYWNSGKRLTEQERRADAA